MPAARMSAWFAALVFFAGSVLLIEHVLFVSHAVLHPSSATEFIRGRPRVSLAQGGQYGEEQLQEGEDEEEEVQQPRALKSGLDRRLAVVVPAHAGDLDKALGSLRTWPTLCHSSTLQSVDLVLYYAGGEEDDVPSVLPALASTGGRCFARTKLVLANLNEEENVYPMGASVQFYKMFLDADVRRHFSEYHALALIEWDVVVAHETSFEKLYYAAFDGVEPFWMKGSTLAGVNFHETVVLPESRHVIGHINGNAIYNNTDPAFVEFVNFTRTRWEYEHSYDVALWATISDMPYSWPLWQRYSRKFVATDLIANIGFLEVDNQTMTRAVASNTLFIHGSLTGGGGSMFLPHAATYTSPAQQLVGRNEPQEKCTAECGSRSPNHHAVPGTSSVCDRSCHAGANGPRFRGYNCGAGDAEVFGAHCRTCFEDVGEAQAAEDRLALRNLLRGSEDKEDHVIMCDTLLPPLVSACNDKCLRKADTICDQRCGSGKYGDYNCNWRNHGSKCRFCFNDRHVALSANEVAKRRGGSVIMCLTREPPTEEDEWLPPVVEEIVPNPGLEAGANADVDRSTESDDDSGEVEAPLTPDMQPYVNDIRRGQLCMFLIGYAPFVSETRVIVESIVHFMPGTRIAIAAHANDFPVYNRTLGSIPGVRVSMAVAPVSMSHLLADRYCGEGTRLIHYLNHGELISRSFTSKDTHSTKGDLLVVYAEVGRVGKPSLDRALATTAVLGFSSPSFSFGIDIILPAETNKQLRDVLLLDKEASMTKGLKKLDKDSRALRIMSGFQGAFIPEVLAALAYSRNPPGLWFVNPQQWVTHHMFEQASIWDIPLVKPRFGCGFDISRSTRGFNVAAELKVQLGHFISGGTCERGFIPLELAALRPKANIEFGPPTKNTMPGLKEFDVSVVFHVTQNVDPSLLDLSLHSLSQKFPDAREAVVVFIGPMKTVERLQDVLEQNNRRARFPVRVVEAQGTDDSLGEPLTSQGEMTQTVLHADEHCKGRFVLHMEAGDVLLRDMTYDNIFHFGKPVLPFKRFSSTKNKGVTGMEACIADAMTFAMREPVVRDFAMLRSLVYPREAYGALRDFVRRTHDVDIDTLVRHGRTSCKTDDTGRTKEVAPVIAATRYDVSLLGTFLWHSMHGAVHWRAFDPLDIQEDEWLSDASKYDLFCDLRNFEVPADDDNAARFMTAAADVDSRAACTAFQS